MRSERQRGFSPVEVILVLCLVAVLAGVGWYLFEQHNPKTVVSTSKTTSVVIIRNNTLKQPGVRNFSITVTGKRATTLLTDIRSMKNIPGGAAAYNCPLDDGVDYTFKFSNPTVVATATATGCQFLYIGDHGYLEGNSFWNDVQSATGQSIDPDTSI